MNHGSQCEGETQDSFDWHLLNQALLTGVCDVMN